MMLSSVRDQAAFGSMDAQLASDRVAAAPTSKRFLVANPGSIPELTQMATALGEQGLLRVYVTPVSFTQAEMRGPMAGVVPGRLAHRLERERARRLVPAGVQPAQVRTHATAEETMFIVAQRLGLPEAVQAWLVRHRNVVYDHRVAALLQAEDRAVIGSWGASLSTFRRARQLGVRTFLDYPIAHHDSSRELLEEERRLQPDWAATLQGLDYPPWWLDRLNAEIALADHVFVLSEFHRRSFEAAGVPSSKLLLAPLGVDVQLFSGCDSREALHRGDRFRVLFVGQLTQRKGLSYVIEGFQQADVPNSELWLVGRRVGKMPRITDRRVHILGPVPRAELPRVYRSADVFVLPSLVEGFALTPMEAMSSGLPVIVTENTFAHAVITEGENGFTVPIRDPAAIADRLLRLSRDPELRHRVGQAARETAEAFTWERFRRTVVQAVASALASDRDQPH